MSETINQVKLHLSKKKLEQKVEQNELGCKSLHWLGQIGKLVELL